MKKGSMHLDWMVSMSIFLVFLLMILIYFKPGAEPAYQKDYLLPIVEANFRNSTYYSIERLPITTTITPTQEGIDYIEFEFDKNFPICGVDEDKFKAIDSSFQAVEFDISIDCGRKSYVHIKK